MLVPMLFAKDLTQLAAFYRTAFGLEEDAGAAAPGYVELVGAGIRLAVHAVPAHVADGIVITDPASPRSDVPVKLVFTVDDVPATRQRVEALGGQVFETASDDAVDVVDPEGNVLRVATTAR